MATDTTATTLVRMAPTSLGVRPNLKDLLIAVPPLLDVEEHRQRLSDHTQRTDRKSP